MRYLKNTYKLRGHIIDVDDNFITIKNKHTTTKISKSLYNIHIKTLRVLRKEGVLK